MSRLAHDIKVAARALVRAKFVSILGLIAFALGIGVTTAVFSIFNGVLLKPLPFPKPERVVMVYGTQPACATCPASFPKYHDWKERNRVFSAIGGSTGASFVLTGQGDPARVSGMATTASLVDVFGVQPARGRWYSEQEDQPGGPKVVVLSHDFWASRLAADPAVVGKKLLFDGEPYEVLGVMPELFAHRRAEVFVPLQRKLDPATRGNHFLATYARLKGGVTVERAATEMRELGHVLAREFGHNHGIDVRSYTEAVVGSVRTPLKVLLGAVFLVLLIACANVANLLLAAGLARRRELAIRLALGARQRDLARQLTTESVLLALAGGVAGLLLSLWAVRTFVVLAANQLPRAASIEMDGRVLAFAGAVTFTVGIFCGLWPLFLLRTRQLASAVREGDMRTASGGGRSLGNGLVVAEIAIAFAMLVGAGLLVKNLLLLQGRDAGVRTERIVAFDIAPAGPRYKAPEQLISFYRELQGRLAQIDLIEGVGMTSHLPMYNFGYNGEMTIEGGNPWGAGENPLVEYRWIDPALPIARVQTLEQVVAGSIGQPRLMSALTGLFGGLAGLLAMVGVYGMMAYNVRRQRREFGIRLALGAAQRDVRALVVGRGLILGIAGVAVGASGAWLLTGLLRTLLHDVKPTDPAIFAGMAAAVLVVTTLASYLPARAAGRVDPMVVLRDN